MFPGRPSEAILGLEQLLASRWQPIQARPVLWLLLLPFRTVGRRPDGGEIGEIGEIGDPIRPDGEFRQLARRDSRRVRRSLEL